MSEEQMALAKVLSKVDEMNERLSDMDARMAKMEKYLERQKGFFGGILLVASCLAWVASQIKEWLK